MQPAALAAELTLLAEDARACGASERGTYAAANVGALVPRRLWRPAQGLTILSATGPGGGIAVAARLQVCASTRVDFVFTAYSIVLALDVSPSMAGLDAHEAAVAGAGALTDCDAIALAQFSLARSAAAIASATGKPVLTTPDSAVRKLRRLLDGGA